MDEDHLFNDGEFKAGNLTEMDIRQIDAFLALQVAQCNKAVNDLQNMAKSIETVRSVLTKKEG